MKKIFILLTISCISINVKAQEKNISSPKKLVKNKNYIEKEIITIFPVKSTSTTDSNYEINKEKSRVVQKNLNTEPIVIIKNDDYYQKEIQELKRRIKEINDNVESENVNVDKLGGLTSKLALTEEEYNLYKNTK